MTPKEKVLRALRQLMSKDHYLLRVRANERSLTHRLAVYVEQEFPDYHVDCEFQKNDTESKILNRFKTSTAANNGMVYPDIIVHHRGTDDNFIVIESKTSCSHYECTQLESCDCDKCKLWAYKTELAYRHAFYIKFPFKASLASFRYETIESLIEEITADPAIKAR